LTRTEQPRSMWVNIVGASHFCGAAAFLSGIAPTNGQRQMNSLLRGTAFAGRRVGLLLQSWRSS
jgi:hypothetical protein